MRAMEILGILIIGGAGLCGFLKLFVMKTQDVLPKLAAALAIAAGKLSYELKKNLNKNSNGWNQSNV